MKLVKRPMAEYKQYLDILRPQENIVNRELQGKGIEHRMFRYVAVEGKEVSPYDEFDDFHKTRWVDLLKVGDTTNGDKTKNRNK